MAILKFRHLSKILDIAIHVAENVAKPLRVDSRRHRFSIACASNSGNGQRPMQMSYALGTIPSGNPQNCLHFRMHIDCCSRNASGFEFVVHDRPSHQRCNCFRCSERQCMAGLPTTFNIRQLTDAHPRSIHHSSPKYLDRVQGGKHMLQDCRSSQSSVTYIPFKHGAWINLKCYSMPTSSCQSWFMGMCWNAMDSRAAAASSARWSPPGRSLSMSIVSPLVQGIFPQDETILHVFSYLTRECRFYVLERDESVS